MTGVEILSSEEVAVAWASWNWNNFWIAIIMFFTISLIAGLIFGLLEHDIFAFLIMFGVMFLIEGGIVSVIIGGSTGEPIAHETHYKVTIDESVSMTEFMDKYEILDQEGKIYTVREKE